VLTLDVTARFEPLDDLIAFADSFDAVAGEIAQEVQQEIEPLALDELATYPGPSQHGGRWSDDPTANDRARRWWFGAIGRGEIQTDGEHYIRTGGYGQSWFVAFSADQGIYAIRFGSTMPGAAYIGGSLNQRSRGEAVRWQNPGHDATGWPVQVDTVNFWVDTALELFSDKFVGRFGTLGRAVRRSRR
jgi:hypothetical protein